MPKLAYFITIIMLALLSCTSQQSNNVETGNREQILHIGNGTEPQDLDPHIVTGVTEHRIISALLEGLVGKHPKTLEPTPAVAQSWVLSDDQTTYTFTLRQNARWSNGDPVTAHDFVYSWQRILSPKFAAEYAYQLYYVHNAETYHKGEITDFSQVGVKALDNYTLQVQLRYPTPFFLSILDHYSTYPVHKSTIEKFGAMDQRGTQWTKPEHYIGNGPFVLTEWKLNQLIKVTKNPYYWDKDLVKLNGIVFYPVENTSTEERMFTSQQLHVTSTLPTEKKAIYKEKNPELLNITPYFGTYYYLFNTERKPFNDAKVRKALTLAIDRESIVNNVTKGGQVAALTFTPPEKNGYAPTSDNRFNPGKAKQLLNDAGFINGENFPVVELLYNTSEGHRKIAVAIQQMWKQHLNIDIQLINQDWKVYLNSRKNKDYAIARAGWIGDYLDPDAFLGIFTADSGNNHTGWTNKNYDALLEAAQKETSNKKRNVLFNQAESILLSELPIAPIYHYTNVYLKSPSVQGWDSNILDHHPYKYIYLENK